MILAALFILSEACLLRLFNIHPVEWDNCINLIFFLKNVPYLDPQLSKNAEEY